jgi:hypothetical protein
MNERLILTALQTLLCIENEEPYTQTDVHALIEQIQSAINALPAITLPTRQSPLPVQTPQSLAELTRMYNTPGDKPSSLTGLGVRANPDASSTDEGLARLAKPAEPPVVHRCPSCGCVYSDINDLIA